MHKQKSSFLLKDAYHQILTDGGMGDLICELVAVNYNIQHYPHIVFHVWVPDYLLDFAKHVLPQQAIVRPFSVAESKFRHDIQGYTTEWCTHHTPMRTHPVDYGFHMLADRHIYDLNQKNYLQIRPEEISIKKFFLKKPYVCIVTTAAEPVKSLPAEVLNAISQYVLQRGYTPVFLGKEEAKCGFQDFKLQSAIIPVDSSLGINLVNKTSLLEAGAVIAGARAIVGIDGGLIHLAGCTETEIVAGYSLVDPIHIAPIRKGSQTYRFHAVEPDFDIPNRYYQTYSNFIKGDYREFEGWEKVIHNLTADKFIKVLELIL